MIPLAGLGVGGKCAYKPAVLGGDCGPPAVGIYGDGVLPTYGDPAVAAVGSVDGPNEGDASPRPYAGLLGRYVDAGRELGKPLNTGVPA